MKNLRWMKILGASVSAVPGLKAIVRFIEFLAAATAVLIALVAIFGYFQLGVPVFEIRESCHLSWAGENASSEDIVLETSNRYWSFYEEVDAFGIANDGRIAYLDIAFEASNSALGCAAYEGAVSEYLEHPAEGQPFWVNTGTDPWDSEFTFSLRGPYAGAWELSIPASQRNLPKNGQYRAIDHGYLFSVEGPFFVEHLESNGFGKVTLYPQTDRALTESEISCARQRLSLNQWIRPFVPCF